MLNPILLLVLAVLATWIVPFANLTSTQCCEGDDNPWDSFRKSLSTYAVLAMATLLIGAILFLRGVSNEATWPLATTAIIIAPLCFVGAFFYGFWWYHLDTRHPGA